MPEHKISFNYLSQEDLLKAGCFDIAMAMEVAEKTMLAYEQHRILFPEKIVQIFDQSSQDRPVLTGSHQLFASNFAR
jgi:hypothetical protein